MASCTCDKVGYLGFPHVPYCSDQHCRGQLNGCLGTFQIVVSARGKIPVVSIDLEGFSSITEVINSSGSTAYKGHELQNNRNQSKMFPRPGLESSALSRRSSAHVLPGPPTDGLRSQFVLGSHVSSQKMVTHLHLWLGYHAPWQETYQAGELTRIEDSHQIRYSDWAWSLQHRCSC